MTVMDPAVLADLAFFADLGTEAPRATTSGSRTVARIVRNGREIELVIHADGTIDERDEDSEQRHLNMRALLASPNFGDIGRWAAAQSTFLKTRVEQASIPISGALSGVGETVGLEGVDAALADGQDDQPPGVRVLLVNGPAGIGKTSLIRTLAYRRAVEYRLKRDPLILHVESRGRMLQNLMDLMAFSLQTLRLNVTYDQVPVLVRRGLVTLAIDGFDELGDPSGYELAWAQVNQLISDVRGRGSLLLAGRETFIGRDRLVEALKALNQETDILQIFTIEPVTPAIATAWLRERGWTEHLLQQENVEPLFEQGSYALRPFFLSELAREDVRVQVAGGEVDDLTWFLVETMIEREASKFGHDVEAVTSGEQRRQFVRRFLGEVARDLADNQTEAIASDSLAWIAEVVASDTVPAGLSGIMKHRAGVVAFLTDDDRRGYKRFSHEQILNHFLARITIDAVALGEVPKYIRRNILGSNFLGIFSEVAANVDPGDDARFVRSAIARISELGDEDRSRRNLASLVLAAGSALAGESDLTLSDVGIDEALVTGSANGMTLKRVSIGQLDARGADLRAIEFGENCYIAVLIADSGTILPSQFPVAQIVQLPDRVLTVPSDITTWISAHSPSGRGDEASTQVIPPEVRSHGLFDLVGRVTRYRPFWIRDSDEKATRRILDDRYWELLRTILANHNLLKVRNLPASGGPSEFIHIRRKGDILTEMVNDAQIRAFYSEIVRAIRQEMDQEQTAEP